MAAGEHVGYDEPKADGDKYAAKNSEEPDQAALFLKPRSQPAASHEPAGEYEADEAEDD